MNRNSLLWILAILTFGVGDALTTWYGLQVGLIESHPWFYYLNDSYYPLVSILALKFTVFVFFYVLHRDVPFGIGVPIGLTCVGVFVTIWNSYLILSVI